MVPRFAVLSVLIGLCGCGSSFENESQELRYLESLSNPSPSQFKRREELQQKKAGVLRVESEREAERRKQLEAELEKLRERDRIAGEEREKSQKEADAQKWMVDLLRDMKDPTKDAAFIVRGLQYVQNTYPGTQAAEQAEKLMPEWLARKDKERAEQPQARGEGEERATLKARRDCDCGR